jgi:hypothetical protein
MQEFSQTHRTIVRHFISTIQEDRNFENLKRATLELDLTSLTAYFNELSEFQKINIYNVDEENKTLLHHLAQKDLRSANEDDVKSIVDFLLENKVHLNAIDKNGNTPIMLAVANNNVILFSILILINYTNNPDDPHRVICYLNHENHDNKNIVDLAFSLVISIINQETSTREDQEKIDHFKDDYLIPLISCGAPFLNKLDALAIRNREIEDNSLMVDKIKLFHSFFKENNLGPLIDIIKDNEDILEIVNHKDFARVDELEEFLKTKDLDSLVDLNLLKISLKITINSLNRFIMENTQTEALEKKQIINLLIFIYKFSSDSIIKFTLGEERPTISELDNLKFRINASFNAESITIDNDRKQASPFFIQILNYKPYKYKIPLIEYATRFGVDINFLGSGKNALEICKIDFSDHDSDLIDREYLLNLFLSIGLSFDNKLFPRFVQNNGCIDIAIDRMIELDRDFTIQASEIMETIKITHDDYYFKILSEAIKSKKKIQFNIEFFYQDGIEIFQNLKKYFELVNGAIKTSEFEYLKFSYYGKQIFSPRFGWCRYEGKFNKNKIPNDPNGKIYFLNGMRYEGNIVNGILSGEGKIIFPNKAPINVMMKNNVIISADLFPELNIKLNFFDSNLFLFSGLEYKKLIDKLKQNSTTKTQSPKKTTTPLELTSHSETDKLKTIFIAQISKQFDNKVKSNSQLNKISKQIKKFDQEIAGLNNKIEKINSKRTRDTDQKNKDSKEISQLLLKISEYKKTRTELDDLAKNLKQQIFNAFKIEISIDNTSTQQTDSRLSQIDNLSEIINYNDGNFTPKQQDFLQIIATKLPGEAKKKAIQSLKLNPKWGKKLPSIEEFLTINVDYFINSSNSTTSLQSLEKINDLFSFDESELTSQEFDNDKKISEILEKSQATTHQLEPLEIKISLSPNPILIPQINSQIAQKFLDLFQRHRKHKITQEITAQLAPAILAKSTSATSIYDISKLSNVDILKIRELLNGELIIQTPAIQETPDQEIANKKIVEEIEEKIYDKLSSFTFGCAEEFQSPKLPSTIPKLQQIFHRKLDYLCKKIQETMGYNEEEIRTLTSHIYTLNGYCVDSTQLTKDQTLSNYDLLINQRRITGLYEGPGHASNATQEDLKKMIWVIDKLIKIDEKFTQELLTSQPASRLTALRIDDTPTHPLSIINFEKYLSNLPL